MGLTGNESEFDPDVFKILFKRYDQDDSGGLDKEELKQVIQDMMNGDQDQSKKNKSNNQSRNHKSAVTKKSSQLRLKMPIK